MKKSIKLGIIICFLLVVISTCVLASGERMRVNYLKTSDGDTMRAMIDGENVRIRFLGINTPEVSGEDKVEEPWGNEALAFSKEQLDKAKKIEIEYDDVADHEDRFGRKLAWIWVDDELFEIKLLERGLAKTYMLKSNYKYADELKAAERKAKEQKIGVWSEESPKTPEDISSEGEPIKEISKSNTKQVQIPQDIEPEEGLSLGSILIAVIIIVLIIIFTKKNQANGSKDKSHK